MSVTYISNKACGLRMNILHLPYSTLDCMIGNMALSRTVAAIPSCTT